MNPRTIAISRNRAETDRYKTERQVSDGHPGEDTDVLILFDAGTAVLKAAYGGDLNRVTISV